MSAALLSAAAASDWQPICERLKTYTRGQDNDADLHALRECLRLAQPTDRAAIERRLVDLLREERTTDDTKEFICRQTACFQSDEAVAVLIALQAREKFSFLACYGLQRIANPNATAALRGVLGKRSGKSQRDVIQTLGALRDEKAVPLITALLKSSDHDLARTAIVALGNIGGADAEKALAKFEPGAPAKLQLAVAEARLKCAAWLDQETAVTIYTSCLESVSAPVRMAAFSGLLSVEPGQRIGRIMAAIRGSDAALKSVAFRQARESGVAELAAALPQLPSPDQAIMLDILREKADPAVAPAVHALATSPDPEVRLAALSALGVVGNVSHLGLLARSAARETGEAQTTVREALARLRGKDINSMLMKRAETGDGAERAECLLALLVRGAPNLTALLWRAIDDADPQVQQAALTGLRSLAGPAEFPELLRHLLAAKPGAAASSLQEILVALGRRDSTGAITDRLVAALPGTDADRRGLLIDLLAGIADGKALQCMRSMLQDPNAGVRAAAVRALSYWPDAAPLDDLLALAAGSGDATARWLALRGVARLAPTAAGRSPEQRVELLTKAMAAADRMDERKALLGALGSVPCPAAVKAVERHLNEPALAAEAKAALEQIRSGSRTKPRARGGPTFSTEVWKLFDSPDNLARGATAVNLDGLQPDGAGQGAFAAIDGNPETYWDETNDQKLYRLRVQLKQRATVGSLRILGYSHQAYAPKDFEVICDDQCVKKVQGAEYRDNLLTVTLPPTVCGLVELRITGYYGRSPGIRELGIYGVAAPPPRSSWPDISTIAPDVTIPPLSTGKPAAGRRVKETLAGWPGSQVYHVLHLPDDWRPGGRYPVLVEYAGNGGYTNQFGDVSTGRPEDSKLGYGLSAGRGFIWVCLPYLNEAGTALALQWWGDKPTYKAEPTLDYCRQAVARICREYGGDAERVILCGFSRGAIACNFLGLHDDATAKLWRAFVAYSHYDGVRQWPYPGADRDSALARLRRLGDRPQFICAEGGGVEETRHYLAAHAPDGRFTFVSTGFRNHNDAWVLRPSEARIRLRQWLVEVCRSPDGLRPAKPQSPR